MGKLHYLCAELKTKKMKDYSKLTDQELVDKYNQLEWCRSLDLAMDMSGDCSKMIHEGYEVHFDAIQEELDKREIVIDENYDEMPF